MSPRRPTLELGDDTAQAGDWINGQETARSIAINDLRRRLEEVQSGMSGERKAGKKRQVIGWSAAGVVAAVFVTLQQLGIFSPTDGWLFQSKATAEATQHKNEAEHEAIRAEIQKLQETIPDATAKRVLEGMRRHGRR